MSSDNPYAAPQADLTDRYVPPPDSELATRGSRFVAAMVDGLIGSSITFPLLYATGVWATLARREEVPFGKLLGISAIGFLGFLLIHGYLLKTKGQTVGKWLLGVRIADLDGAVPSFGTLIFRRYLPITLISQTPVVGAYFPLLDDLFIFREDHRCIHDLLAGTKVVMTRSGAKKTEPAESTDWMFKKKMSD